jgi:hypothetical protein
MRICLEQIPELIVKDGGHRVRCWLNETD